MNKQDLKLSLFEEMASGDFTNLTINNANVLHVVSTISEEQLEDWYELYGFDRSKYRFFMLDDAEKVINPPRGVIAIYQVQLDLAVRFPVDEFVILALQRYNLALAQLLPNASMLLNGFVGRAKSVGVPHGDAYCEHLIRIFRSNYEVVSRSDDIGRVSFRSRFGGVKIFADMGRHSHLSWESKYAFLESINEDPLPLDGKFKVFSSFVNKRPSSCLNFIETTIQEAMTDWSSMTENGEPMTLEAFLTSYLEVNYGDGKTPPILTEDSPNWKRIDLKSREIFENRKKKNVPKEKKSKKEDSLIIPPLAIIEPTMTKKWHNTGKSVAFKRHLSYGKMDDMIEEKSVSKKMKNNNEKGATVLESDEGFDHFPKNGKKKTDYEDGNKNSKKETSVTKGSSTSKTSKVDESLSERTVTEEPLGDLSPRSEKSKDSSQPDPAAANTSNTPAADHSDLIPPVTSIPLSDINVKLAFTPSSSTTGEKPSNMIADEDKVNLLLNIIASTKKSDKGKKVQEKDGFSSLPIDVLIEKVAKLQLIQLESAEEFKVLSQELVSRLFAVNAVMNHEMQISAQLQEDVIKYKMMANRFALLTPQRTEESALEIQNRRLIAEVEVMKLRMKKMEAAMIEKDLQDKV